MDGVNALLLRKRKNQGEKHGDHLGYHSLKKTRRGYSIRKQKTYSN